MKIALACTAVLLGALLAGCTNPEMGGDRSEATPQPGLAAGFLAVPPTDIADKDVDAVVPSVAPRSTQSTSSSTTASSSSSSSAPSPEGTSLGANGGGPPPPSSGGSGGGGSGSSPPTQSSSTSTSGNPQGNEDDEQELAEEPTEEPLPEPEIVSISVTTHATQAWLNYSVKAVRETWVQWGNASIEEHAEPVGQGNGTFSIRLAPLQPLATYKIRLNVVSLAGESNAGTPIQFSTPARQIDWATGANVRIQPGMGIYDEEIGRCTLAFILVPPGNATIYALTAGHCIGQQGVGTRVLFRETHELLGTVVLRPSQSELDFALIAIEESLRDSISPAVKHWTGPTRMPRLGEIVRGDLVCYYGQGSSLDQPTPHRCGKIVGYTNHTVAGTIYGSVAIQGSAAGGDSGTPVVHYSTGTAVGILVGASPVMAETQIGGPTVCSILEFARQQGFNLRLAGTDYAPPPPEAPAYGEPSPNVLNYATSNQVC